jgi:hypothetical protein
MFKKAATWILFPVLIITGIIMGRFIGNRFVASMVLKNSTLPLLFTRPVNQFYDMYVLMNSGNPYSRLSGYYSLIDNKMINNEFLMERYQKEENFAIKRTILWILSFSNDSQGVLKFYASIFNENTLMMKDILVLMKRINADYYMKFVETRKIDKKLMP